MRIWNAEAPGGVETDMLNVQAAGFSAICRRLRLAARNRRSRISLCAQCASVCAVFLASLWSVVFAQAPCSGIHVTILNITNSVGTVDCAFFDSAAGFPADVLHSAAKVMVMKIRQTQARCDFEDIPPGTYAIAVIHDENMNGKLDKNWLGVPTEGYGFSNGAKAIFGPPSFEDASFRYDGQPVNLTISLHY
jgi:uncharacterized protein (DUF2141 family)